MQVVYATVYIVLVVFRVDADTHYYQNMDVEFLLGFATVGDDETYSYD